jgi:ankyrin repeat protein
MSTLQRLITMERPHCKLFRAAAGKGNIELLQILLAAGADFNAPAADHGGMTALQAAAAAAGKGNIKLVQILLAAGVDVSLTRSA